MTAKSIKHPKSDASVFGTELGGGSTLKKTDVYASSNGTWRENPCPGGIIQANCRTLWVRPSRNN